jgi:hypothetical protein
MDSWSQRSALESAKTLLRTELAHGPRPAREIETAAAELQLSSTTMKRARKALGVKSERAGGVGPNGWWELRLPD